MTTATVVNPIREMQDSDIPEGFARSEDRRRGAVLTGNAVTIRWTIASESFGGPGGPAYQVIGEYRSAKRKLDQWEKTLTEALKASV